MAHKMRARAILLAKAVHNNLVARQNTNQEVQEAKAYTEALQREYEEEQRVEWEELERYKEELFKEAQDPLSPTVPSHGLSSSADAFSFKNDELSAAVQTSLRHISMEMTTKPSLSDINEHGPLVMSDDDVSSDDDEGTVPTSQSTPHRITVTVNAASPVRLTVTAPPAHAANNVKQRRRSVLDILSVNTSVSDVSDRTNWNGGINETTDVLKTIDSSIRRASFVNNESSLRNYIKQLSVLVEDGHNEQELLQLASSRRDTRLSSRSLRGMSDAMKDRQRSAFTFDAATDTPGGDQKDAGVSGCAADPSPQEANVLSNPDNERVSRDQSHVNPN